MNLSALVSSSAAPSQGTWLLFTDDDDLWAPQRVRSYAAVISAHAATPGVTAICATHKAVVGIGAALREASARPSLGSALGSWRRLTAARALAALARRPLSSLPSLVALAAPRSSCLPLLAHRPRSSLLAPQSSPSLDGAADRYDGGAIGELPRRSRRALLLPKGCRTMLQQFSQKLLGARDLAQVLASIWQTWAGQKRGKPGQSWAKCGPTLPKSATSWQTPAKSGVELDPNLARLRHFWPNFAKS